MVHSPTPLDLLRDVQAAAKTTDLFHTPKTKQEMDTWLKSMPTEMPTGVALMVGMNFIMHQMMLISHGQHPDQIAKWKGEARG